MNHFLYIFSKIKGNKMLINGSLFSFFSFINKGIGFILLIILAKYIMPAEYGRLSLFSTISSFMALFICLSTDGYISISYFQKEEREMKKDIGAVVFISFVMVAVFSILIVVSGEFFSKKFEIPVIFLWLAILISFFNCMFNIHQNLYIVKEKVLNYGIFSCSNAVLNFALSLFLVIILHRSWVGRIEAWTFATVIVGAISMFRLIKERYIIFNGLRLHIKEVLLYGVPIIPHLATAWIKQGCDQFIIKDCYSVYEVGVFSFALNLTSLIVIIGTAFNSTNSVAIYKILSDNTISRKMIVLRKKTVQMILVYVFASACIVFFMNLLVAFLMPKYTPSIPFFYLLSIYGFLQCIYLLYCNYFFYYKKTRELMYITFVTSILHLILSLFFTRYSLYYTSFIYIVSQSVIDVMVYYYGRKILNKALAYETIQ